MLYLLTKKGRMGKLKRKDMKRRAEKRIDVHFYIILYRPSKIYVYINTL